MFRLYEATIISLRVPEIYTAVKHIAVTVTVTITVTVTPIAEISSLYETFVKIAFGEYFYSIQKYCKKIINNGA
jgi:hypothetical protein